MTDKKNKITELLNSPEWQEMTRLQMEWEETENKRIDDVWGSLDNSAQMDMFYAVVKRLHQGELVDHGTYRWVLYNVFGFGPEAYEMGMRCGFLNLHNSIYSQDEFKAHVEHLAKKKAHLENPTFDDRPVSEFSPGFTVEKSHD
jgi:Icc-related predicted phosphoesterase